MSGSAVLGTAIGLVLVFALLSLFCSAITEAVSQFTERRARYLLTGLRSMLDRPESAGRDKAAKDRLHADVKDPAKASAAIEGLPEAGTDLTLALFGHPLIRSLQTRRVSWFGSGQVRNPQYISPTAFTRALVDTLLPAATATPGQGSMLEQLRTAVLGLDDRMPAKRSLLALIMQAEGDMTRFETATEDWYDEQMSRISGWYKRWAKVVLAVVGLAVAIVVNVDTVQVAQGLYVDAPVREAVVAEALNGTLCRQQDNPTGTTTCVNAEMDRLGTKGLPIWYASSCNPPMLAKACWTRSTTATFHWYDVLVKLLGWVLTAFAVTFGAPFWFDALSRLGSLRTAGPRPAKT